MKPLTLLTFTITIALSLFISCSSPPVPDKIPEPTKDFCSSIHRNDTISLSKELKPYEEMMQTKTGVYVLEDGGGAMVTRAWLSEYAERTIDIQYFIFSSDNVGLIACDYLVRAADRGVKVRILVDDIMVDASPHELITLDSHENIDIRIYNPCCNTGKNIAGKLIQLAGDFHGFNQRMHNKTFTVDGKVTITGGRNIADEYFDYDHEYNFRDRDVLLIGKSAGAVENSFEDFWNDKLSVPVTRLVSDTTGINDLNRFEKLHQYACDPANFWPQVREQIKELPKAFNKIASSGDLVWTDAVSFVPDVPGKNKDRINNVGGVTTDSLISLVMHAKTSVDIQTPYLITTDLGKKVFKDAIKRGVKIRILTNSLCSTDNLEAFSGYQRDRKELLETGIRIWEFKPDAQDRFKIMTGVLQEKMNFTPIFGLHAKSMVIDGNITVIGTFNLDPRSANLNCECVTIIRSAKIASGVLLGMEEDLKPGNSWETTSKYNPDSEAGTKKQFKTWTKRFVPKEIL